MEEQETVQITVIIAGRPYPLKIKSGDEPEIRKIVKEINEKINQFQLTYSKKDKQDCLSMTLLTYAVDLHKTHHASGQINPTTTDDTGLSDRLQHIDDLLSKLIN